MNEQATKKSSPVKWIVLGCGGCAVLGIGFFVLVFGMAMALTGPAADAAHAHVKQVQAGDADGAYDSASNAFKQSLTKEEFKAFTQTWQCLYGSGSELTLNQRNVQNNTGTMKGSTTGPNGNGQVTIVVINEGGAWRVQGINITGDQSQPESGGK